MESGWYPLGTENDPKAPWNETSEEQEIEVTVSVTLSKTVKVRVNDYTTEEDYNDSGKYLSYNFSSCNLHKAVEDQITLPQDLALFTERMFDYDLNLKAAGMPLALKESIADCKDWSVDDYEVIIE